MASVADSLESAADSLASAAASKESAAFSKTNAADSMARAADSLANASVSKAAATAVSSHLVNEPDPQNDVLDYATPKARSGERSLAVVDTARHLLKVPDGDGGKCLMRGSA